MNEKELTNQIIEFLNYTGKYFCWRVNSGMVQSAKGHFIKLARAGSSDILGIEKGTGRTICLEVKLPKTIKTVTAAQREYLDKMKSYGAITGVVTSPEEAVQIIEEVNPYENEDSVEQERTNESTN